MTESLCTVNINLDALKNNHRFLSSNHKKFMPVVKNDAYGHGILEISKALQNLGVEHFAVGTIKEGILLRQAGIEGMITPLLGCTHKNDLSLSSEYKLTTIVHNTAGLEAALHFELDLAIKVDTGMGRLGFRPKDMISVSKALKDCKATPKLMLSHFSSSDCLHLDDYTNTQAQRMKHAENLIKDFFPDILTSYGNSATMLAFPELSGDLPRPGITLYGGNPFYQTEKAYLADKLMPAMSVSAPILSVHTLNKGDSLSYGKSFTAQRDSVVAWLAIGYADGYRRVPTYASKEKNNQGLQVCIHNTRCPVIGHINMQMTAVDITDLVQEKKVQEGDYAYLLNGCSNGINIDELAYWWGTIPHDVTTTLGKNRYHGE